MQDNINIPWFVSRGYLIFTPDICYHQPPENPTDACTTVESAANVFGEDVKDFAIRFTQFFDHYLKGAPMPIWMSHGVRAADKGIISGLDLDTSNAALLSHISGNSRSYFKTRT